MMTSSIMNDDRDVSIELFLQSTIPISPFILFTTASFRVGVLCTPDRATAPEGMPGHNPHG